MRRPRLREAGADDGRQDRAHAPTSRRSRRGTSASRSARTRSAASRRPCGSSRQHGGESVVLTLGPAEAEEQLRDAWRSAPTAAIHLVTDGEEWDPQATAAAIVDAIEAERRRRRVRPRSSSATSRPTRQLPGRDPGRLRARPARRHRAEGHLGRGRARPLRARGSGRAGRLRGAAARRRDGARRAELPRYPSVPGKCGRSGSRSRRRRRRARAAAREGAARRPRRAGKAGRGARSRRVRGAARRRECSADRGAVDDGPRVRRARGRRRDELSLQALTFARALRRRGLAARSRSAWCRAALAEHGVETSTSRSTTSSGPMRPPPVRRARSEVAGGCRPLRARRGQRARQRGDGARRPRCSTCRSRRTASRRRPATG